MRTENVIEVIIKLTENVKYSKIKLKSNTILK